MRSYLIQVGALRNTMIEIGPYWTASGFAQCVTEGRVAFARDNSKVLKPRIFEIFIKQFYEAPKGTPLRQFLDKIGESGIWMLKMTDGLSATATWLGAYEKAIKAYKMPHEEAVRYADDVVTITQASGHRHDLPIIQREDLMRSILTLFQTFTINEWNFLGERVFGKGPLNLTPKQRFGRIFWFLAATAAFNAIFEDLFQIRSPFPAPEKAIRLALEDEKPLPEVIGAALKETAEQIPIIGGTIRWSTAYKTFVPAGAQLFVDLARLLQKLISGKNPLEVLKPEDFSAIGKLFGIPGTGETEKIIRRLQKGLPLPQAILGVRTDILDNKDVNYLERLKKFFERFDIDSFILRLQATEDGSLDEEEEFNVQK